MKRQLTPSKPRSSRLRSFTPQQTMNSSFSSKKTENSRQNKQEIDLCDDVGLKTLEEFLNSKFVINRPTKELDLGNDYPQSQNSFLKNKKGSSNFRIQRLPLTNPTPPTSHHRVRNNEPIERELPASINSKLNNTHTAHRNRRPSFPPPQPQKILGKQEHGLQSHAHCYLQTPGVDQHPSKNYSELFRQNEKYKASDSHRRRNSSCFLGEAEERNTSYAKSKTTLQNQTRKEQFNNHNNNGNNFRSHRMKQRSASTLENDAYELLGEEPSIEIDLESRKQDIPSEYSKSKGMGYRIEIVQNEQKEKDTHHSYAKVQKKNFQNSHAHPKQKDSYVMREESPAFIFSNSVLRQEISKRDGNHLIINHSRVLSKSRQEENSRAFPIELLFKKSKAESAKNSFTQNKNVRVFQTGISQLFKNNDAVAVKKRTPIYTSLSSLLSSMSTTILRDTEISGSYLNPNSNLETNNPYAKGLKKKNNSESALLEFETHDNRKYGTSESWKQYNQQTRQLKLNQDSQASLLDYNSSSKTEILKSEIESIKETVDKMQESISRFQVCFSKMNQMMAAQEVINHKLSAILSKYPTPREGEIPKSSERDSIKDYQSQSDFEESSQLMTSKQEHQKISDKKQGKMKTIRLEIQ